MVLHSQANFITGRGKLVLRSNAQGSKGISSHHCQSGCSGSVCTFSSSFCFQVELGAPGFPPHLLNSFIKQQPLVVAKLASFLRR